MASPRPADRSATSPTTATDRPSSITASRVDASDWPVQAADTIERVVQGVRDKTTGPAINAARWLVAGLFALVAGTMVAILLAVALVRFVDAYLPDWLVGEDHVWAAHGLVGLFPFVGGLALLRKRHQPAET